MSSNHNSGGGGGGRGGHGRGRGGRGGRGGWNALVPGQAHPNNDVAQAASQVIQGLGVLMSQGFNPALGLNGVQQSGFNPAPALVPAMARGLAAPTSSGRQNVPREPDQNNRNKRKRRAGKAAVAKGDDNPSKRHRPQVESAGDDVSSSAGTNVNEGGEPQEASIALMEGREGIYQVRFPDGSSTLVAPPPPPQPKSSYRAGRSLENKITRWEDGSMDHLFDTVADSRGQEGGKQPNLNSAAGTEADLTNTGDGEMTDADLGNDAQVCGNCKQPGHVVSRCWVIQKNGFIRGCAICNCRHDTHKCKKFPPDKPGQIDLLVFKRANLPPLSGRHWYGMMFQHMERYPTTKVQGLPWSVEFCQELRMNIGRLDRLAQNLSEGGSADSRECDPNTKSWEATKTYFSKKGIAKQPEAAASQSPAQKTSNEAHRQPKDSTQPQGSAAPRPLTRAEKRATSQQEMVSEADLVRGSLEAAREGVDYEIDYT